MDNANQVWDVVTAAAGAITALGVALLYVQVRDARAALKSNTRFQVYGVNQAVFKLMVDYPELRKYFYEDQPIPEREPDRSQVLAAAELILDLFEVTVLSFHTMDIETRTTWEGYIRVTSLSSPALRHFLQAEQHRYKRLHEIVYRAR